MPVEAIKETLSQRQQELSKRLEAVQRDLQKRHSADWSEQAQERENDEVLEGIAEETSQELAQVKAALLRFEQGDYGTCNQCGCDIDPARLAAVPEAQQCIRCAS